MGKKLNHANMTRDEMNQKADELERAAKSFEDFARKMREAANEVTEDEEILLPDLMPLFRTWRENQVYNSHVSSALIASGWDGADVNHGASGRIQRFSPEEVLAWLRKRHEVLYFREERSDTLLMFTHAYRRRWQEQNGVPLNLKSMQKIYAFLEATKTTKEEDE